MPAMVLQASGWRGFGGVFLGEAAKRGHLSTAAANVNFERF
jgi:hypothetical protein